MRMDSRFSPLASGRSGFPPFGTTGYGMGMNLEPGLSPNYGGGSNFGNSPGYGRMLSPYYSGNSTRYSTPIGYGVGNARNDSVMSPTTRNPWGNGGLNTAANPASPGAFLGSGSGSFGVSFGNSGVNWGPSHVSAQGGGSASGYTSGSMGYGSGGDSSYGLGGGGYGRTSGTGAAPTSSFAGSTGVYEGSYGDLYRSGSVYGDSSWRSGSGTPELDGTGSFGYGLGNIASDVTTKNSEGYIGSYGVTSRQSNRGIAT
ncbi:hypothetical protein GH714_007108 [Hevea brasiliensis]|nr:hypothetical protein GH714_007108 [Hevea brasiliensis]